MSEKEKMLAGKLYLASDPQLTAERQNARRITRLYNATGEDEQDRRQDLIRELFGSVGTDVYIEPSFRCDYGYNIKAGNGFYANFDCIILDVCPVNIGDNVFFGPCVKICTATHPLESEI
ncbi:MAG: acetyltransferase, partial [Oscillospiraceae bacterium]|nr:acetyltransferase [Oscillospiraceae bacterium]